jgi:D-glycero-beta-D-manno-heptose-7-phosphate kinase
MRHSPDRILDTFSGMAVAVWGDLMLDEYVFTSSGRVSREAPVLVTELEKNEYRLGGAGNVVMNLLTLGARPLPLGFIGKDRPGRELRRILRRHRISTDFLVEVENFQTPVKSRILSGASNTRKQQILRIDSLPRNEAPSAAYRRLQARLQGVMTESAGLIVSDYLHQSVRASLLRAAQPSFRDRVVAVDSRRHLFEFSDMALVTPNEPEIKQLFPECHTWNDADFLRAGSELMRSLKTSGVLLKLGHRGMIAFASGKKPISVPIYGTSQIVDGTGAGDTVLAVAGLGLIAGVSLADCARLATVAAGIVVMQEGAWPICGDELKRALK